MRSTAPQRTRGSLCSITSVWRRRRKHKKQESRVYLSVKSHSDVLGQLPPLMYQSKLKPPSLFPLVRYRLRSCLKALLFLHTSASIWSLALFMGRHIVLPAEHKCLLLHLQTESIFQRLTHLIHIIRSIYLPIAWFLWIVPQLRLFQLLGPLENQIIYEGLSMFSDAGLIERIKRALHVELNKRCALRGEAQSDFSIYKMFSDRFRLGI